MNAHGRAGVHPGIGLQADGDVGAPRNAVPVGVVPRQWHSRGNLPQRDKPHLLQSITYRLADSLPQEKLRLLESELISLPEDTREAARRQKIEHWLDSGLGCCALRHPEVARYVQNSFLHFHGERYHLHAWCIMPNHVHVLIEPLDDLVSIVQGWKSFTSRWALARNTELGLGIPGQNFWMREYWDRYIRDETHYQKTVEYIHQNPVSAGLCVTPQAWPWSSAAGSANPGSAGVPAGIGSKADEDVGAPSP
jgi:type I restriction enzyme R subunit/putative DNA methylase